MAQTFTNNTPAGTVPQAGVGRDYPMQMAIGRIGELADISGSLIISGNNETTGRISFGVPLVRNGSGVLPNSVQVASAAGAILGFSVLTDVHEVAHRQAATPYQEGILPNMAVNVLKQGAIYLEVFEALAPGNALRYFKSGTNAGKWGKTASAGNSLNLAAGNWEIEKGASAGGLIVLRVNAPAALTFTADA
jgi:hypothetical protein